ncbi:MAG: DUF5802 family protein [Halorhabdus sp.]
MFEQFSRSYYLGRLYVEPRPESIAAMCARQHQSLRQRLYQDDGERPPLVMKLGSRHFPVTGADSVPADTLAVPPAILRDSDVENPPSLREVLLATGDRAEQLLSLSGVEFDPAGI